MPKSLKDQALEAAQAVDAAVTPPPVDSQPKDKQDGLTSPPAADIQSKDGDTPKDVTPPADVDDTKPVQKEEPKPQVLEVDGQTITPEDVRKWREDSLNKEKWQTDLTQKSQEISGVKTTLDQIKDIFVKEDKNQTLTPEEETFRKEADNLFKDPYVQGIIQQEIEKGIEQRHQQESNQKKEDEKKQFQDNLVKEVKNLENDLNGSDGRPKYSDAEILQWQKENKKLYLTPREAYESKYRNELFEWEVQKRLKNKAGDPPKPTSTSTPPSKNDTGEKTSLPTDVHVRRKAMLDALQAMGGTE